MPLLGRSTRVRFLQVCHHVRKPPARPSGTLTAHFGSRFALRDSLRSSRAARSPPCRPLSSPHPETSPTSGFDSALIAPFSYGLVSLDRRRVCTGCTLVCTSRGVPVQNDKPTRATLSPRIGTHNPDLLVLRVCPRWKMRPIGWRQTRDDSLCHFPLSLEDQYRTALDETEAISMAVDESLPRRRVESGE